MSGSARPRSRHARPSLQTGRLRNGLTGWLRNGRRVRTDDPTTLGRRVLLVAGLLALLAAMPTWKLIGVQVRDGSELVAEGRNQRVRHVDVPAQRGSILDRNGVELAISVPRQRVVVDMATLIDEGVVDRADMERFARLVAAPLEVDAQALADKLAGADRGDPWVPLAAAVEDSAAEAALEAAAEIGVTTAIRLEQTTERVHPAGESAVRLIGVLGTDGPSELAGIESRFNDELEGRPGKQAVEIGVSGETIVGSARVIDEARGGSDVVLTLDRTLQYELEQLLAEGTAAAGASRGLAVLGRPSTGEILAAGSVERHPDSGDMRLTLGPSVVSDSYQAGSVFKLVTVAAALEAGAVGPDQVFQVPHRIAVDDRFFSDSEPHPTQAMSVTDIVAKSSNVGTIMMAQDLGAEPLRDALVGFGFGRRSGLGHPAEAAGILPPLEDWTRPDLAATAIGTHQSATAVQLWAAYNVIANGGMYVQPRLVESIVDPDGTAHPVEREEPRRVISDETAQLVGGMLEEVVREGTGRSLDLPGYSVAAKTGTSRMVSPERVNPEDSYMWPDGRYHYVTAFTGYLPADDPQVSITVLLEDTRAGLTGATAAGPVFASLAELAIRELGIAASGLVDATEIGPVRAEPASDERSVTRQRTTPARAADESRDTGSPDKSRDAGSSDDPGASDGRAT